MSRSVPARTALSLWVIDTTTAYGDAVAAVSESHPPGAVLLSYHIAALAIVWNVLGGPLIAATTAIRSSL